MFHETNSNIKQINSAKCVKNILGTLIYNKNVKVNNLREKTYQKIILKLKISSKKGFLTDNLQMT